MKFILGEVLKACKRKWRRIGSCRSRRGNVLSHWFSVQEEEKHKDVPKGHVAVHWERSINVMKSRLSLLKHSLLQALLDQAQPKLCAPCDECVFMEVVRCANVPELGRLLMCR